MRMFLHDERGVEAGVGALLRTKALWPRPRVYAVWLVFSVFGYTITYFSDPYVFGFTVLGLGTVSLVFAFFGMLGAIIGFVTDRAENRACGSLLVLSLLIGVTSITAFQVLRGFRWN